MSDRLIDIDNLLHNDETVIKKFSIRSLNPFETARAYYFTEKRIIEVEDGEIKAIAIENVENVEVRTEYSRWGYISILGNAGGAISMLLSSRMILSLFFVLFGVTALIIERNMILNIVSKNIEYNMEIVTSVRKNADTKEFVSSLHRQNRK